MFGSYIVKCYGCFNKHLLTDSILHFYTNLTVSNHLQ
ncbi:MAG TPA: hypothetical protein DCM62_05240 [Bacteroidales bacterium]|nr:hypothetical protein [Bacteroidales bacterium]